LEHAKHVKPKSSMWIQAGCLAVALALVGATPAYRVSLLLAAGLAIWWLVFDSAYARKLDGARRSPERSSADRHVTWQALAATGSGLAAGVLGAASDDVRLWHDIALSVCFAALATLAFLVYASSLVDWYFVRPRVDGVVRTPPCRSSREPIWGFVTRMWFLHRAVAQLLGVVAILVAATALAIAVLVAAGQSSTAAVVAIGGVVLACVTPLMVTAVQTSRAQVVDEPDLWVGDRLVPASGPWRYLLQVTVSKLVVRAWDVEREAFRARESIALGRVEELGLVAEPFASCEGCMVNPDCEWTRTDHAARLPRRRLVL